MQYIFFSIAVCNGKHLEIIRSILHSNINTIGHFYPRFFSDLQ